MENMKFPVRSTKKLCFYAALLVSLMSDLAMGGKSSDNSTFSPEDPRLIAICIHCVLGGIYAFDTVIHECIFKCEKITQLGLWS